MANAILNFHFDFPHPSLTGVRAWLVILLFLLLWYSDNWLQEYLPGLRNQVLDAFAEGKGDLDEETVSDFNLINLKFRWESNTNINGLHSINDWKLFACYNLIRNVHLLFMWDWKSNRKVKFVSQITALINWSFDIDIEDEGALVEVEKLVCNP